MTDQPLNKPQDDNAIADDDQSFEDAFAAYAEGAKPAEERDEYHIDRDASPADQGEDDDVTDAGEPEQGPDDLAARLKELEEENEKLRHSDASQRGRLGAYQRQINELQRKQQELQAAKPTNPDGKVQTEDQQRQSMAESMGVENWAEFKEDFPEIAGAFEARQKADQLRQAQLEQQIADLRNAVQPIQQQAHEQQLQSEIARLDGRHTDWREVVNAPEFTEWLQSQNPNIQQLSESENADDVSALLDFYKSTQGIPAAGEGDDTSRAQQHDKRHSRLANAQTVSRRGAAKPSGAPDEFDAAFEHYAAKKAR